MNGPGAYHYLLRCLGIPVHGQSVIYGALGIAPDGFAVCLQLLLVSTAVLLSSEAEWWLRTCSINRLGRNLRLLVAA